MPAVRVVALADADPSRLADARSLAPDARAETTVEAVLDQPDVEAVVIALPPALHASAAIAALSRGKHIYLEKPLAVSVAEGKRVVDAWSRTGLTAMMGFNYRRNPVVLQARRLLAAGRIGTPVAARTVFSTPARAEPPWKGTRASGGGVLLDLAVHHVDLLRFLLGADVADVSAVVRSLVLENDTAFVRLRMTNGCTVQSFYSLGTVDEDRVEVYGTTGKVTMDRYRSLRAELMPASPGGALGYAVRRLAREWTALPYALRRLRSPMHEPSFRATLEAFVTAARAGTRVEPDLHDGYRALAVVEAAETAARSGRSIAPTSDDLLVQPPLQHVTGR